MEALAASTLLVALAEIGDKTQLLAFVLAARLRRPWAILAGITVATLANHAAAAAVGGWLASLVAPATLKWILAAAFLAFGLWALVPDKFEGAPRLVSGGSAFLTTLVAFFLVEMGDKTQLATVALAARYESLVAVVAGTTAGMLLANGPAVWIGERLAERIDMRRARWIAAALFIVMALATVTWG